MMAKQTWSNSGAKVDENMLQKLEGKTGFRLPEEYRKFLTVNNGGTPSESAFGPKGKTTKWLDCLLPITSEKKLTSAWDVIKADGEIFPPDTVPIGIACGVSHLLLGKNGKVYLLSPEVADQSTNSNPKKTGAELLAKSFGEFLNSLRSRGNKSVIAFVALDKKSFQKPKLLAALRCLGCKKKNVASTPPMDLWDWPKFKGIGKGQPAWIHLERNRMEGFRSKFPKLAVGHPILTITVSAKDQDQSLRQILQSLKGTVLLEIRE